MNTLQPFQQQRGCKFRFLHKLFYIIIVALWTDVLSAPSPQPAAVSAIEVHGSNPPAENSFPASLPKCSIFFLLGLIAAEMPFAAWGIYWLCYGRKKMRRHLTEEVRQAVDKAQRGFNAAFEDLKKRKKELDLLSRKNGANGPAQIKSFEETKTIIREFQDQFRCVRNSSSVAIFLNKTDQPTQTALKPEPLEEIDSKTPTVGKAPEQTKAGSPGDPVKKWAAAIQADPRDADSWNSLGLALSEQSRLEEAAQAFRKAIGLKPGYSEANCNLCIVLGQQGKFDEAVAAYRAAISTKPDFSMEAAQEPAFAHEKKGSDGVLDEAREHFQLARKFAIEGRQTEAINSLSKAVYKEFSDWNSLEKEAAFAGLRENTDFMKLSQIVKTRWQRISR